MMSGHVNRRGVQSAGRRGQTGQHRRRASLLPGCRHCHTGLSYRCAVPGFEGVAARGDVDAGLLGHGVGSPQGQRLRPHVAHEDQHAIGEDG